MNEQPKDVNNKVPGNTANDQLQIDSSPLSIETPKPVVSSSSTGKTKKFLIIAGIIVAVAGAAFGGWFFMNQSKDSSTDKAASTNTKTKIVIMTHWLEKPQIEGIKDANGNVVSKGFQAYLDEYESLNPNVDFELQQVHFNDYPNRLRVLADSGASPDIYHIYAPWGAQYVRAGILAEPPADIQKDVEENYISTSGPSIEGKLWGIPTEIDNYALLYNKDLFKQAGIVDSSGEAKAPKTWQDVVDYAKKLAKHDGNGAITQYGIAFTKDAEWQVADPFLSLLFSNGGKYLTSDLSSAAFNDQAGVEALKAQLQLFTDKSVDLNGNFFDFQTGKVAMVVAPPWPKSSFASSFGANFEKTVGVAPFPYLKEPATLQYSWFTGVMKDSDQQQESWKFLRWLTSEQQDESGTTRMGDLLADTIGAIPARKADFDKHNSVLDDFFTSVYVGQMPNSTAEPNVLESDTIKEKLIAEIQAAWAGQKTAEEALNSAATEINKILDLYY